MRKTKLSAEIANGRLVGCPSGWTHIRDDLTLGRSVAKGRFNTCRLPEKGKFT